MSVEQATDVVIIGGGVIGSALAYFLRKADVEVTVLERANIAAESSSAAAGLLSPLGALTEASPFTDLVMASRALIMALIPELEELSGERTEYYCRGSLRTAKDVEQVAPLQRHRAFWETLGWQVNWLTGAEARQREPLLASTVEAAVYASQEGSISAAGVTRVYAGAARRLGARFIEQTNVVGIERTGTRVTGARTATGETIRCARLVIAAGAWSADLGKELGLTVPVRPMRGQILALVQPATPLEHILFGEGVYLVPKPDGTIFVGATVEQVGFDKQLTASGIAWLLNSALKLVPALAETAIARMWAGLRPGSPDDCPLLGRAPGWENVILATGHGGMGFEMSAITGQSIAELLVTGQVPALISPFRPERFIDPAL
jgi:glycine oxidase